MSAITFESLVRVALKAQPCDTSDECGVCGAGADELCAVDCDNRGEVAMDQVADLIGDLPRDEFVSILRSALEREMVDDETPGFFWAWSAVDDEAQVRGLGCPVGI
ncbi:hypothetical protein AB0N14_17740 [Streptomyces sp. NPDC051104]|uniref:hypothetical protein n=1 Tax=Streptomyces sp. NPDC051104 TaxID=3155044 RepID=UPI00342E7756